VVILAIILWLSTSLDAQPQRTPAAAPAQVSQDQAEPRDSRYGTVAAVTLSVVAAAIGLLLLYLAYFLYEPEEKAIQATLEEWWLIIEVTGADTFSKHQQFVHAASVKARAVLDFVFGPRLWSMRALWPAAFLCYGGTLLVSSSAMGTYHDNALVALAPLGMGLLMILLGLLPAATGSARFLRIGCVLGLIAWLFTGAIIGYSVRMMSDEPLLSIMWFGVGMTGLFVLGTFIYLLLVGLVRWGIDVVGRLNNLVAVAAVVILQVAVIVALITLPDWISLDLLPALEPVETIDVDALTWWDAIELAVGGTSMVSLAAAWPVGAFLATFVLLLMHRVIWPILSRPVYAVQRHKIISNRKLLGRVGATLLILSGLPGMAVLGKRLLGFL
jgi:hypothetical protein